MEFRIQALNCKGENEYGAYHYIESKVFTDYAKVNTECIKLNKTMKRLMLNLQFAVVEY